MTTLLHRQFTLAFFPSPLITAAVATAYLRLLFETSHGARIGPARALQVIVMLVAVFLKPAPHVTLGLMAAQSSHTRLMDKNPYPVL
jgi:hypothetical protein